jgi:hypothetical protein
MGIHHLVAYRITELHQRIVYDEERAPIIMLYKVIDIFKENNTRSFNIYDAGNFKE